MTEKDEKVIKIRIDLDNELAKKFLKLKESWGLSHNTETIRHLISKMYEAEGLEFVK